MKRKRVVQLRELIRLRALDKDVPPGPLLFKGKEKVEVERRIREGLAEGKRLANRLFQFAPMEQVMRRWIG